ncbi:MAG: glycosyltransferase [Planctomycetota bacterium]
MQLSFIVPTRNRADDVRLTLHQLGTLHHPTIRDAEVIIIDNDSDVPLDVPVALDNGWAVTVHRLDSNQGTGARNVGARAARGDWLIMLDDDSAPLTLDWVERLHTASYDIAVIASPIVLRTDSIAPCREAGGLPSVFIGCGAAIRRETFLACGGYDESFGYYAEEYDFAAKLLARDLRVVWDPLFVVHHRKVTTNRDMNIILERLVVNNTRVILRHAPARAREQELASLYARCRVIAEREDAQDGLQSGLAAVDAGLGDESTPLTDAQWDAFRGVTAVRAHLRRARAVLPFQTARLIEPTHIAAKHRDVIENVLEELHVQTVDSPDADIDIVATLSPGPMLDTADMLGQQMPGRRILTPWSFALVSAPTA